MKRNEIKNQEYYRRIFNEEMSSGKPIYNHNKMAIYEAIDGERWKQCFDPDDPIRKDFPIYLFISDHGRLISVLGGKARLLQSIGNNRYHNYCFQVKTDDGTAITKSIGVHNIVNIVFNGLSYGKARTRLNEQGVFAFDVRGVPNSVQGHHINNDSLDNTLENTEALTTEAHMLLNKLPQNNDTKKLLNFMRDFSKIANDEESNKDSVLLTGQTLDPNSHEIIDDNGSRILFTVNKFELPQHMNNMLVNSIFYQRIATSLVNRYGMDYFNNPRFICINNITFLKYCLHEGSIKCNEIDDICQLAGKDFIMCYIDSESNISIYVPDQLSSQDSQDMISQ